MSASTLILSSKQVCMLCFVVWLFFLCVFGVFLDKVSSCSYLLHVGSWCKAILARTDGIPFRLNRWCTLGTFHVFHTLIGFETVEPGSSSSEVTPPKNMCSANIRSIVPAASFLFVLFATEHFKRIIKAVKEQIIFAVKTILCVSHLWKGFLHYVKCSFNTFVLSHRNM